MLFVLKLVIFPLLVVVSVSYCIYCSLSGIQSMAQFYFTGAHLEFLEGRVLIVCSFHVTYAFQSESTIYSCLNVKELLAQSRREIWRWGECNWTRTQNHLVLKRTLNHAWTPTPPPPLFVFVRFSLLDDCFGLAPRLNLYPLKVEVLISHTENDFCDTLFD